MTGPAVSITIDSAYLSYRDRPVLRGLFLSLETGDTVGLIGKNGSGKTSLFEALLGLRRFASGTVFYDGRPFEHRCAARKIGYLSQESFLPRRSTVGRWARLLLSADELGRADVLLTAFDLRLSDKPSTYSQGQRRLAELSIILAMERPFLLLDEPFARIDPIHVAILVRAIRRKGKDSGIIIADHDYRNILQSCTRIVVLQNGAAVELENEADLRSAGYLPESEEEQ